MWFKIQNRTINFDTITNFLCNDDSFMILIEFIGGSSNRFSFETWGEYYDVKTYLNDLASNHEKMEEERKIQKMLETRQKIYPIGSTMNDILKGRGLKPLE